jgi:hypothetical protein
MFDLIYRKIYIEIDVFVGGLSIEAYIDNIKSFPFSNSAYQTISMD